MKTVYCLRVRSNESEDWGEPSYYRTRKERDDTARINRILGGIRCWSYDVKKTADEIKELFED